MINVPVFIDMSLFQNRTIFFTKSFDLNIFIDKESEYCLHEVLAMSVTAAEFKLNLGKYLKLVESEDIFITENGNVLADLSL